MTKNELQSILWTLNTVTIDSVYRSELDVVDIAVEDDLYFHVLCEDMDGNRRWIEMSSILLPTNHVLYGLSLEEMAALIFKKSMARVK